MSFSKLRFLKQQFGTPHVNINSEMTATFSTSNHKEYWEESNFAISNHLAIIMYKKLLLAMKQNEKLSKVHITSEFKFKNISNNTFLFYEPIHNITSKDTKLLSSTVICVSK